MKKTPLQYSMLLGAAYDWFFGLFILFFPYLLAKIIHLKMPAEEIYLRLDGLFLLIIGVFYSLYWISSERYKEVVFIAIASRTSGFIFFTAAYLFFIYPFTFLLLGIGDGFWAALHYCLYRKGTRQKKSRR